MKSKPNEMDIRKFIDIADKSVKETIKMFFKYPLGYHGDTGLQHYLYHRIFSNAGKSICWHSDNNSNMRTLLFQSEIYTECKYRNTGKNKKSGRFDMAFVSPPADESKKAQKELKFLIAFEVGRNKSFKTMGDITAPQEVDAMPGDAAKIIRDLRFGELRAGYILEFFDQRTQGNIRNAQKIAKELSRFLEEIDNIKCHIAISLFQPDGTPLVWFYPSSWAHNLNMDYEQLNIEQPIPSPSQYKNRISYEEFLKLCGDCGRPLQEAIHEKYSQKLKLLYGGKTMTVNIQPAGRLFRIGNRNDKYGECIYEISDEIEFMLQQNIDQFEVKKIFIPRSKDEKLIKSILEAISQYLRKKK